MISKKQLKANSYFGLFNQIIAVVCGLILPKLILNAYGSEVNGLVSSISGYLNVIALTELGVGAVVQTSLYKPLAENDINKISRIYNYSKKFFKGIGIIFAVFLMVFLFIFPLYNIEKFDYFYTTFLILSLSISFFAQYFFGIVNQLLLKADQKSYIIYVVQTITIILNTILCFIFIKLGFSIQIVKLTTSIVYLLRPLFYYFYVKSKYKLLKIPGSKDDLPQKWNGMAQHISAYVLNNTDIMVLNIFSDNFSVSIYSVYYNIIKSLHDLIVSFTGGLQAFYGKLIAIGDSKNLEKQFFKYTKIYFSICLLLFSIANSVIVPFIMVYTKGVKDTNYNQPIFGSILIFAQIMYVFRYLLSLVIFAYGDYKETQIGAIIEAILNIVISVVLVMFLGLEGVAIGTLIAMFYRAIYFTIYISKKYFKKTYLFVLKYLLFSIILFGLSVYLICYNTSDVETYLDWFFLSVKNGLIILLAFLILLVFFEFKSIFIFIKSKIAKKNI